MISALRGRFGSLWHGLWGAAEGRFVFEIGMIGDGMGHRVLPDVAGSGNKMATNFAGRPRWFQHPRLSVAGAL